MATTEPMIESQVIELEPSKVKRGWRARKDLGDISDLARSIDKIGQLHPILVKVSKKEEGFFVIISGMRRLRACKQLKRKVRAIICRPADEIMALTMQLEENVKRKNFDKLEVGEGLLRFKEKYEVKHPETKAGATLMKGGQKAQTKEEIAGKKAVVRFTREAANVLGISERAVYDLLEIGSLPEKTKAAIAKKKTTRERNKATADALKEQRGERKVQKLEDKAKEKEKKRKTKKETPEQTGQPIHLVHSAWQDAVPKIKDESIDLVCTDPQYGLKRSVISHAERSSLGKKVSWDNLDLGWVAAVVSKLVAGGTIVAFCPFELIGEYKWAFEQLGLEYHGHIVWHKCISENTRIPVVTDDGLHQLRPSEVQPGDRIISVDENGNSILAKVVGAERMGHRDALLRVTLVDGNVVEVTPNHRIPVGQNKLIEAGDLKVGDKVQVATRFPLEEPGSEYKEAHDLGRIIGVWLGDGGFSSTRNSRVEFYLSRAKQETIDFLTEALPRLFDAKINRYDEGEEGVRLYCNNERLRAFIGGIAEGRTSKTKRIRPSAYFQGVGMLQGIVDGFCETDGAWDVQNKRWRFNQANGELLRDLSIMLKVLGKPMKLRASRVVGDGTGNQHVCYPAEFRPEPSAHHNATFKSFADGTALIEVARLDKADGANVWDLMVDSPSHLFVVDHGMLVHNSNPPPAHRKVYMGSTEAMVWATKPGKPYHFREWKNAGSRAAHNCIELPVCGGNERLSHDAQKPEALIERLLKRHAPSGGVVLDLFAGTGTTAVCCKRRKLTCIAIEKKAKYVKMAKLRLKAM